MVSHNHINRIKKMNFTVLVSDIQLQNDKNRNCNN
jgi:hypothetical protein